MNATIAHSKERFEQALVAAFGTDLAGTDSLLVPASNPKFGDYQANVVMLLAKKLGMAPRAIAEQIIQHLNVSDVCDCPLLRVRDLLNWHQKLALLNKG